MVNAPTFSTSLTRPTQAQADAKENIHVALHQQLPDAVGELRTSLTTVVTAVNSELTGKVGETDFIERVQDAVAALLAAGTGVTVTYDDAAGKLTLTAASGAGGSTDPEVVRDTIGVALAGVGLVSVVVNDASDTITISTTATANATDAALRARSSHTGTQTASTISDFATAAAAAASGAGFLSPADLEVAADVAFHPDLAKTFAGIPDAMFVGAIDRSDATRVRASVVWPDTATGSFVGTIGPTGGIDSYTITHVLAGVTLTYAQPAMTRDSDGAVITRPAITVTSGAPVTPVIPVAPTLTQSGVTTSGVTISGAGGSNVASLVLRRGATTVASALPFTDSGLSPSTPYTYTLTATSSTGNTATSTLTVTTAAVATASTILADNFTAADGAIDGRTLPDGSITTKAWSHLTTPARMTIVGNTAKATAGYAAAFAVVDTGITAYKVGATFPVLLSPTTLRRAGIIFRAQSDTNYFRADANTGAWLVRKIIAGTATTLITGGTAAAGDVVEVTVAADNSITLRVNGVVSGTAATGQTDLATVTNAGIYGQFASGSAASPTVQDPTSSVDAFSITTL